MIGVKFCELYITVMLGCNVCWCVKILWNLGEVWWSSLGKIGLNFVILWENLGKCGWSFVKFKLQLVEFTIKIAGLCVKNLVKFKWS